MSRDYTISTEKNEPGEMPSRKDGCSPTSPSKIAEPGTRVRETGGDD